MIVEHGAWIKERGRAWTLLEPAQDAWKNEVKEVLTQYVDRTPGASLEEKDYSLALHYRKVDAEIAPLRIREAKEDLLTIASELNLEVLEGDKVLEVRNPGINKGLFSALPDSAYSIKVGVGPTRARYNLDNVAAVRSLLKILMRS